MHGMYMKLVDLSWKCLNGQRVREFGQNNGTLRFQLSGLGQFYIFMVMLTLVFFAKLTNDNQYWDNIIFDRLVTAMPTQI